MRKIKVNYEQMLDVLACHLESVGAIKTNEHVTLTPLSLDKNGFLVVYVHTNNKLRSDYAQEE